MTELSADYVSLPAAPSEEDVAKTIAEYETIAIGTGAAAEFDAPEFTADGTTWSQVWLSQDPPVAARATARRDGAASTVVVLWNDALPAEDSWRDLWLRRPMPLFGAYVRRDAIRHAFRDAIGDRREPGDHGGKTPEAPAPERDWDADLENASTVEQLTEVWAAARTARARTAPREVVFERRLAQLEQVESDAWGEPGTPAQRPARPAPRDHLPASSSATKRRKKRSRR
jgi:hypothetical protein